VRERELYKDKISTSRSISISRRKLKLRVRVYLAHLGSDGERE